MASRSYLYRLPVFSGGRSRTGGKCPHRACRILQSLPGNDCVNIIGEKNLEYEVEENYAEVARLLDLLGLPVNMRYVHDITFDEIPALGAARLNILREPALMPVGDYLRQRFGTPFIPSFPTGLSDTLSFRRIRCRNFGIEQQVHWRKNDISRKRPLQGFPISAKHGGSSAPVMRCR